MDYLNTYKPLDEEIVFASLEGKVLRLLPEGTMGGWFLKQDGKINWCGDCYFDFDLLEPFPLIRKAMLGKSLEIFFAKKFQIKLISNIRIGGYKEPFVENCVTSVSSSTVYQALVQMNNCLKKQECSRGDAEGSHSIIDFESYQQQLQLVKKNYRKEARK